MEEEKKIENEKESELETRDEKESDNEKSKKNYKVELVLLFVVCFLIGVMFKTEALKKMTVGFNDYEAKVGKSGYDIEAIEKKMMEDSQKTEEDMQEIVE